MGSSGSLAGGQPFYAYGAPPGGVGPSGVVPPPSNTLGATAPFGTPGGPTGVAPGGYGGPQAFGAPPMGQQLPGHHNPGQAFGDGTIDPNVADGLGSNSNLPSLAEIDLSVQCDPTFLCSTVNKLHVSQVSANATRIPLGVVCKPMAGDVGVTNDKIEVVDFGSTGIIRCKRCRTYVNPFVSWIDNGRRWRCNICGMLNDVPTSYFSHLDSNGQRRDKDQRPELSRCSVEFVAPGSYTLTYHELFLSLTH